MSITFVSREDLPTYRPDVNILVERELGQYCKLRIVAYGTTETFKKDERVASYHLVSPKPRIMKLLGAKLTKVCCKFFAAIKVSKKHNSSMIISRDNAFLSLLFFIYTKFVGRKSVFWISIMMGDLLLEDAKRQKRYAYILYSYLYRFIESIALKYSDIVIAQSNEMKTYFENDLGITGKVISMPMGIDEKLALDFRNTNQVNSVPYSMGYLGAIDMSRNIPLLLDAVMELRKDSNYHNISLKIVGGSENDNAVKWLQQEITLRKLDEVVCFTGQLPRENAWRELMTCDVCVSYVPRSFVFDLSSPTKLVEYLALGKKVVANDIPDQSSLLEELSFGTICESNLSSIVEALKIEFDKDYSQETILENISHTLKVRGYKTLGKILAKELGVKDVSVD